MASKYWLKLYHEMLDDPKMARLSDRVFRRMINLFLLAGDVDEEGHLPSLFDIAYRLRVPEDDLLTDLQELAKVGIVEKHESGWVVTNFGERQAPIPSRERSQRYRDRQRRKEHRPEPEAVAQENAASTVTEAQRTPNANVTEAQRTPNANVTEAQRTPNETFADRDIDRDPDPEEKARPPPGEAEAWATCLEELKLMMTKATYDTHLGGCRLTEAVDGVWRVEVPNKYGADWLNFRWKKRIDELASGIAGRPTTVQFWAVEGQKF